MRILYINTLYDPYLFGGAEKVLQAQVEAMRDAGHDVAVLTIGSEAGLHRTVVNRVPVCRVGIENIYFHFDELNGRQAGAVRHAVWHLRDSYNPPMGEWVSTVAKDFEPDVACCHNLAGWSVSAWDALAQLGVPIVQVLHDQYFLCARSNMFRRGQCCTTVCNSCRMLRLPHRRKSVQVDTLVGVSDFIVKKVTEHGYFRGVRSIRTIPNILDVSAEALSATPRPDDGQVIFGYIGRLCPEKGVELLLKAFVATKKKGWRLRIAGNGESSYEARLKSEFRDPDIAFLGRVSPSDFFPSVDFTVIPSLWEDTFPSVAFESILYGVPVLGSNIGGIPEIVNSGNGMLFKSGNLPHILQTLELAANRLGTFKDRFLSIREGAARFRDKDQWLKQWSDVYASAIDRRTS